MDMNGFTGVRHKPNLNPDNEVIGEIKPVFMGVSEHSI